jgi:predicted RNase H-like nuclease
MPEGNNEVWVAGVDGCPGGWLVAFVELVSGETRLRIVPRFAELLDAPEQATVIAIDIPIGLPERVGAGGRTPERLVRPYLGERQSSVFSVPARAAFAAADYGEACALALATSDPPRKISRQLYPELAFWRLNGERALDQPKKIKSRRYAPGLALRRSLLIEAGYPGDLVHMRPPKGAGEDDLLDALACAATARRIAGGRAQSFPHPPERDRFGLPIAIWA